MGSQDYLLHWEDGGSKSPVETNGLRDTEESFAASKLVAVGRVWGNLIGYDLHWISITPNVNKRRLPQERHTSTSHECSKSCKSCHHRIELHYGRINGSLHWPQQNAPMAPACEDSVA